MQPIPAKNSVLVMDNCSIHHVAQVKDLLESSGIVIFLPPYSPEYNPVENLFNLTLKLMNSLFSALVN